MLADVAKLVEIAVNALKRKSELDKQYFDNFIEPIWTTFVQVHEDYKKSFRGYLDFTSRDGSDVESLIELMRSDSIDTSNIRSELKSLINNIPPAYSKDRSDYLQALIKAIHDYFETPEDMRAFGTRGLSNLRFMGIVTLSRKRNEALSNNAIAMFDTMLRAIQSDFEKVAEAYHRLKKELLS